MNNKDIDCLEVAAEAFDFEQVNFDEMIQREIDVRRVNNEIVSQYLENDKNTALFFPPLIVSIVAFDEDNNPIHKYESFKEKKEKKGSFDVFYKTWDRFFQLEIPMVSEGFDFYSSEELGVIKIYKHAACLNYNSDYVKFVVIDGQHRFKALKEYWRRHPDQNKFLNIPVCICFSPKAIESNGTEDILDTLRNMFVTINNTGKKVSGHYIDLLNDNSLASQTVRALANKWKGESKNPLQSKLQFIEWNQRSDSKARRVNRPHSISTVSMLCESLRTSFFAKDKNENFIFNIMGLREKRHELEAFGDSIHTISESEFSHKQKDILYEIIKERLVEPLEILLTSPSVYKEKIFSFNAAVADSMEKDQKGVAGFPTFVKELQKFNDVDKELHTEESLKASSYFYGLIKDSEHLQNYTRLVFNSAYLKCWSAIADCHHAFRSDLIGFTKAFCASLEHVAFNEAKMVFSKSRIYNQLTLYKGSKPNTTNLGKDAWYDLLMSTFVNEDQKSVIREWILSNENGDIAWSNFLKLVSAAKERVVERFRVEVMKDNLKNWKTKEYALSFRRELELLEEDGKLEEIERVLEEKSKEQVQVRIDLLSNVLGISVEELLTQG
jgi:DGQHR domain-containing protein